MKVFVILNLIDQILMLTSNYVMLQLLKLIWSSWSTEDENIMEVLVFCF